MTADTMLPRWIARAVLALVLSMLISGPVPPAFAGDADPFASLAGWWGGDGRLRFKDGKQEQVKCRATYIAGDTAAEMKQTIRCASGSGKIEVVSLVKNDAGKLTGTWTETVYNVSGELEGQVTPRGFRVTVKGTSGSTLSANMDIIVKETKQVVEIQFFSDTLVGLTLVLNKG